MMAFTLNLGLAIAWLLLSGEWNAVNFAGGFVVGYAALWVVLRGESERTYFRKTATIISFAGFFLYELVLSNLRLAVDILRLRPRMTPAIVAVPLDVTTDFEIVMLANFITLTPGTLSLELSEDRKTLYVHSVYSMSPEETVREIKQGFERRVIEVCR